MPEMEDQPVAASGGGAATPDDRGGFQNADDDKENLPPWRRGRSGRPKSGSGGRKRRRSILPAWYPRTPLRDITAIVRAIEMRRARMRELEGIIREQNEEVASPVFSVAPASPISERAVTTTLSSEDPKPADVLLTPQASKVSVEDINNVPQTDSLTVVNCSKEPEAASVKEISTSLEVTGRRIFLGLETPDVVPDKVTSTLYTPDSVLAIQNSECSVTTSDGTPVEEVVVEKWWLKKRVAETTSGRTGFGLEGKKNSLLQHRSKVSLMR
ncbi:uncharacterized protein LOC116256432 [Nymphaea colorata]|nr:uncharacterized protein LOC116256432 [Nymphaea colorata]XP_049934352.1 uncharacterized protein LOC116256432 [Nymphaea colorata]